MAVIRPEKVAKVAEIQELLSNSKCTILVDFCGLTVAQDTELRRKMREAGVHYNVVKNTLLRIAAEQAGIEGLEPSLEKNTAIAVSPEDPVAVAKIVCEFAKENKELKSRLEEMTTENNRLQQNSATLERYKELYKMDQNTADYPKVAANVIASENSNWISKFTIDKGSNDGIREDMNVLSGTGLVGIVTEVGPNWATVSSIIDDKNVSAMILTTFDKCIVSGDLQTVQDGLLKFEQLANNENEVAVGEQVVTSNISSKYLQGLLVGYISEVNVDSNNLTRSGYIIPATDFKELQEVLVITTTKQDLIDGKGESGSDNGGE